MAGQQLSTKVCELSPFLYDFTRLFATCRRVRKELHDTLLAHLLNGLSPQICYILCILWDSKVLRHTITCNALRKHLGMSMLYSQGLTFAFPVVSTALMKVVPRGVMATTISSGLLHATCQPSEAKEHLVFLIST